MVDAPFGELSIGDKRVTRGRTITETDVVHFCMLTGNWMELHSNVEFAKKTLYGQRLVQGALVFSIITALVDYDASVLEAFYGTDRMRFLKPTFINDTLRVQTEVIKLREKGERHGIATLLLTATNQRDEMVVSCEISVLVRKQRLYPEGQA
jgi:acyl dehydratase